MRSSRALISPGTEKALVIVSVRYLEGCGSASWNCGLPASQARHSTRDGLVRATMCGERVAKMSRMCRARALASRPSAHSWGLPRVGAGLQLGLRLTHNR
jgi:hypothetical protein